MSRVVSIRSQLKKYMQRFGLGLESCQGDATRLRKCLITGNWRNVARWMSDGTYRAVRSDTVCNWIDSNRRLHVLLILDAQVLHVHPNSVLFTRKPRTGWVIFHEMEETKKTQYVRSQSD